MAPDETTQEIPGLVDLQRGRAVEQTLSDLPVVPQVPRRVAQRPSKGHKRPRTSPRPNWLLYVAVVASCAFLGWAGATILTSPVKGPVSAATPVQPQHPTPSLAAPQSPSQSPSRHHSVPVPTRTHAHPTPTHHVTPHPVPSHTVTPTHVPTSGSTPPPHTHSPAPSPSPTRSHQPPSPPASPTTTPSNTAKPSITGQPGTPPSGSSVSSPGAQDHPTHTASP